MAYPNSWGPQYRFGIAGVHDLLPASLHTEPEQTYTLPKPQTLNGEPGTQKSQTLNPKP